MEQKQIPQLFYKYLIVGDAGVGKTSLLLRYTSTEFLQDHKNQVQGIDDKDKNIYCADFRAWLNIWDTAGQQKFNSITKSSYKGRHGILLAYSITNARSFNHIDNWIEQIKNSCSEDTQIILIGCKCDLEGERRVTKKEAQQMAEKHRIRFFQVSSMTNRNVYLAFFSLTKEIFEEQQKKAKLNEQESQEDEYND